MESVIVLKKKSKNNSMIKRFPFFVFFFDPCQFSCSVQFAKPKKKKSKTNEKKSRVIVI